jgi:hypothetical protein
MTKKQIIRFIEKVTECDVHVNFYAGRCSRGDGFYAYVFRDKPKVIYIYLKSLNDCSLAMQKQTLLHEVGHAMTLWRCKNKSEEEFRAQMWGINKAKKLGMHRIVRTMMRTLELWTYSDWKSCERRYRMAGMLARKKKII